MLRNSSLYLFIPWSQLVLPVVVFLTNQLVSVNNRAGDENNFHPLICHMLENPQLAIIISFKTLFKRYWKLLLIAVFVYY